MIWLLGTAVLMTLLCLHWETEIRLVGGLTSQYELNIMYNSQWFGIVVIIYKMLEIF